MRETEGNAVGTPQKDKVDTLYGGKPMVQKRPGTPKTDFA